MAQFSQGGPPPPPPMVGLHSGRIPTFKNNHGENFQTRCGAEPPACVQNAMLTKDKKPFTYTPGGLDLSQIRTPSMARRLNRQQQEQENSENPAYFRQPSYNGGHGGPVSAPPPPPPPPSGPPPPPPLVINVTKPEKTMPEGERPEIVIPDNPIGMLRKTNSPYHWESELSDRLQQGPVPKFAEKSATPSPVAPQMRKPPQQAYQPPSPQQFSQMPPQQYTQPPQYQQPMSPQYQQPISPQYQQPVQQHNKSPSTSPIWKPEPKYPNPPQSNHSTPVNNCVSPAPNQIPTKNLLQRQDSQFNHSPSPYSTSSSSTTTSSSNNTNQSVSPYCETQSSTKSSTPLSSNCASPWKQDTRNSPYGQEVNNSPIRYEVKSPMQQQQQQQRSPISPNVMIRSNTESPAVQSPKPAFVNSPNNQHQSSPSWRQQQATNFNDNEKPAMQIVNGNSQNNNQQQYNLPSRPGFLKSPSPPKQSAQPEFMTSPTSPDNDLRFQTHMTIPVTPRKQKDAVESPKENMPWARNDNVVNKSAPPPPWCQKPTEGRNNFENNEVQPPWVQRQSEGRKSLPKETVQSPPSSDPQPPWVTDNRRYETLPRTQVNKVQSVAPPNIQNSQGRIIPIQMDVMTQEINRNYPPGSAPQNKHQPQLRIIIGMNNGQPGQPPSQSQAPQQHISRVLTPQLMRMDNTSMSTPTRTETPMQLQPRTRIIPIQMEPSSPGVTSPRVMFHRLPSIDCPPRQSRSFRVLQHITGTQENDEMINMENHCGYTDL